MPIPPALGDEDDVYTASYTHIGQPMRDDAEFGFVPASSISPVTPVAPLSPRSSSLSHLRARAQTFSHPARAPSPAASLMTKGSMDLGVRSGRPEGVRMNLSGRSTSSAPRPSKSAKKFTSTTTIMTTSTMSTTGGSAAAVPIRPRRRPAPLHLDERISRTMDLATLGAAAEIEDQLLSSSVSSMASSKAKAERTHPHRSPPRAGVPHSPISPNSIRFSEDGPAPYARSPLGAPSHDFYNLKASTPRPVPTPTPGLALRPRQRPHPLLTARSDGNLHSHVAPHSYTHHHHANSRAVQQQDAHPHTSFSHLHAHSEAGTETTSPTGGRLNENVARRVGNVAPGPGSGPFLQPAFNKSFSAPSTPTGGSFMQVPSYRDFPAPPTHHPSSLSLATSGANASNADLSGAPSAYLSAGSLRGGLAPPPASLSRWSLSTTNDDVNATSSNVNVSAPYAHAGFATKRRSRTNSVAAPPSINAGSAKERRKGGQGKIARGLGALARLVVGGRKRRADAQTQVQDGMVVAGVGIGGAA